MKALEVRRRVQALELRGVETLEPRHVHFHDDVVREGVPERFAELVRKLDVPANPPQVGETGGGTNDDGRD